MAERTTSAAKEYLERRADRALERYDLTSQEAFNQARQDQPTQEIANTNEQTAQGSEMVANDQPSLQPRPGEEIARPVDREAFDEKWAQEQERAAQDYERADDYER